MKKDQELIKQNNIKLLLTTLLENRPISRAALAKKIKMSPTSITRLTGLLIANGLVVETDLQSQGVGRHAIMLDTVASSAYSLGIEIKSCIIRLSLVNLHKECEAAASVTCDVTGYSLQHLSDIIYSHSMAFLEKHNIPYEKIVGIGICIPGVVDVRNNLIEFSTQLKWRNQDILTYLNPLFKKPIIVENDSKSRIIGEKSLNHIPDGIDAAMLIIGNGVSAAAISRGKIVRGFHNAAGEIGHITLEPDGIPCDCGNQGCLQTRLSDKFLIRTAQQYDGDITTLEQILKAYHNKISWAQDIVHRFQQVFRLSLDILESCYNPAVIIISGNVVTAMEEVMKETAESFMCNKNCSVRVVVTPTQRNVAATGCAIIASNSFIHTLIEGSYT